ncbi:MAG: hypothetical protein J07AB43_01700 [Candidatus Nanosalina sp. J07AB43]|jgi:hypothetical protein|nr:MAG: hypothetical protein J07AB43_01700 [Candidatus Nanosalina sp. J07AB43]
MTDETSKVRKPHLDVYTKHIMPLTEEEWEDRQPTQEQKKEMVSVLNSLKNVKDKLEFDSGFIVHRMTMKNAKASWVSKWINPKDKDQALNGEDVGQAVSLVARKGPTFRSGPTVNLITGNTDMAERLLNLYNEKKNDIKFLVITDSETEPSSSKTKGGYRVENVYMVDFMTEDVLDESDSGNNKELDEFQ